MKFILKKLWWLIIIIIIIAIVVLRSVFGSTQAKVEYTTEIVKKGNLQQTVEATGAVKPISVVELRFLKSGILKEKKVEIGTRVDIDDVLLVLDDRELKFQKDQAAASLSSAQANLNSIIAGASDADINVSEKTAQKAYIDYQNALTNLEVVGNQQVKDLNTYSESYLKAQKDLDYYLQALQDTTNIQEQTIINYNNSAITSIDKSLADCQVALDEGQKVFDDDDTLYFLGVKDMNSLLFERGSRLAASNAITEAQVKLLTAKSDLSKENIDSALESGLNALNKTFENLSDVFEVLTNSTTNATFTTAELSAYKSNISTKQTLISSDTSTVQSAQQSLLNARLNKISVINTAESNITSAQNALNLAKANYESAQAGQNTQATSAQAQADSAFANYEVYQAQLELKKATPRKVDLAPYQAQVAQASAAYELAEKNWQDTSLRAPIQGIVTDISYEIGEQINASTTSLTLMSVNDYEIKVEISESDITKVKTDDNVDITFDALGDDEVFFGEVSFINPAQTILQEVIYYEVTISFDKRQQEIKPGMTSNITIHTAERDNVIYVSRRAVIDQDDKKIVRVLENNQPREIEVTTGLKADDGLIEITSGLDEGMEVITFIKEL